MIQGNFIGTDPGGISPLGNSNGIEIDGSANTDRRHEPAGARNVISGNDDGVFITGDGQPGGGELHRHGRHWRQREQRLGKLLRRHSALWIRQHDRWDSGLRARNLISWNSNAGLEDDSTGNNLIDGNFIGTDVTGSVALGNTGGGLWVADTNGGDTIGGTTAGAGNLISGNGSAGVQDFGSGYNLIEGNDIGTDVSVPSLSEMPALACRSTLAVTRSAEPQREPAT